MPTQLSFALLILICLLSPASAQDAATTKPPKLYELRIYTAAEGKLPDLHARVRDHALRLLEKHGIESIVFWTVSEGTRQDDAKNMLIFILAHKDKAAADASWAAFGKDPDWQAAVQKSEANGKLLAKPPVSIYMTPTDFSPPDELANAKSDAAPRLFELRQYNVGEAALPGTVDRFKSGEAELFRKHGMATLSFWTATDKSAFIYLLAHKDRETSRKSWQGFFADFRQFMADYNAKRAAQPAQPAQGGRRGGGGGNEIRFLVPTDYSPRK